MRARQRRIDRQRLGERRRGALAIAAHQIDRAGVDQRQAVGRIGGARPREDVERLARTSDGRERHAVGDQHVDVGLAARATYGASTATASAAQPGLGQIGAGQRGHVVGRRVQRERAADRVRGARMVAGLVVQEREMHERDRHVRAPLRPRASPSAIAPRRSPRWYRETTSSIW